MRNRRRKPAQAGITLIEMLVVVTIIALFAALVLPRMLNKEGPARRTAAHAQINGFQTGLGARQKGDSAQNGVHGLGKRLGIAHVHHEREGGQRQLGRGLVAGLVWQATTNRSPLRLAVRRRCAWSTASASA